MKDHIRVTGEVEFEIRHTDGRIEYEHVKNLVVSVGRERLAKLLAGDETGTVQYFRIGTGTTASASANTALQTQVNITSGVNQKAIDSATYPAVGKVQFNFTLDNDEGNGNDISEYALYTSDGVMFARVVRSPFAKTSGSVITGRWKINF